MRHRMSPADAVWLRGENPRNPMMVSSVMWFDRPFDVDRWRTEILTRQVDQHPVFRQRAVESRNPLLMPHWENDPDFDLDRHIEVIDLPAPGDHATLQQLCSEQRSRPLDRDRPLWFAHVFQGYRGTGSAIHLRIHHSIGDGLALMRLLLSMVDEARAGDVVVVDPPEMHLGTELLDLAETSAVEAVHMARHPSRLVDRATRAFDATRWGIRLLVPPMPSTSSALVGVPSGRKVRAWDPEGLPLEEVKAYGRDVRATVNDVLLTALTGGLRRYLQERDALVDEVLVMVPVNLRPPDQPLPRHLGNQIGLLPVLLPTGLVTPAQRLANLQDQVRELRAGPAPEVSRAILTSTALLTPPGERALHRLNQLRSTGVVTNVPGPSMPLHLAGARIEGTIGWGGMTGHLNLGVAFISLSGRVFPGVVTDEDITPDPERLLELTRTEWEAMQGDHVITLPEVDPVQSAPSAPMEKPASSSSSE